MPFTALTRLQIRQRVRNLTRDEGYPTESINEALSRVIADINNSGRYRFQEGNLDIQLILSTASYAMSTTTFIGDIDVIYQPSSSETASIPKMVYNDALAEGRFASTTPGPPEIYALPGDGTTIYIDPIPSAAEVGKTLRIIGYRDMLPPTNDTTAITILPPRYHENLLVYGTVAQVAPSMQIQVGEGFVPATAVYQRAFTQMVLQEKWRPHTNPKFKNDERWTNLSSLGNVGRIR